MVQFFRLRVFIAASLLSFFSFSGNSVYALECPGFTSSVADNSVLDITADRGGYDAIIFCATGSTVNISEGVSVTGSRIGFLVPLGTVNADLTGILNNEGSILHPSGSGDAISVYSSFGTINNGSEINDTALINGGASSSTAILVQGSSTVLDKIINFGTISTTSYGGGAIRTQSSGTINTITNWGTISTPINGYDIYNAGSIGTINNLQGGADALTYAGSLPSFYNIIINSSSDYGKFSTGTVGAMTFGISTLSTEITELRYADVVSGADQANFTNYAASGAWGEFGGANWWLELVEGSWDLVFETLPTLVFGPSSEDTLASMRTNSAAMKSAFNREYSALVNGVNLDCSSFDGKALCASVFGRRTEMRGSSYDTSAAGLVIALKASDYLRIGGYLDQPMNEETVDGVQLKRANPYFGGFAALSQGANNEGFGLRLAANYGKQDLNVTRAVADGSTAEAGSGSSDLKGFAAQVEATYQVALNDTWTAKPYAGLRVMSISRDGYTEETTDAVQAPLSYAKLKQETTSVLGGAKIGGAISSQVSVLLNGGVEHDLRSKMNDYSATGVDGLDSITMNDNMKRTRMTAGAELMFAVADNHEIAASVQHRREIFSSENSTNAQVSYSIGF